MPRTSPGTPLPQFTTETPENEPPVQGRTAAVCPRTARPACAAAVVVRTVDAMPNYCSNRLTIRGDEATIDSLLAKVTSDDQGHLQLFASLHPMPAELVGTTSPVPASVTAAERARLVTAHGADNWYDWANSDHGWGTKWGDCDTVLADPDDSGPEAVLYFTTAWSPPIYGIVNISKLYPTLGFLLEFAEPGCDFAGETMVTAGTVLHDIELGMKESPFARECGYDTWGDDEGDDEGDEAST
jgi:hypothetical protein